MLTWWRTWYRLDSIFSVIQRRSITWALPSVLILSGTSRSTACLASWRSSSTSASSVASAASEAPEAHSSTEEAHDLRKESAAASATPIGSSSAHASDVLALWLDGKLTTFEQWFVQMLCLHRALFWSKLDICLPKDWKVEVKLGCNKKKLRTYPKGWEVRWSFLIWTRTISPHNLKWSVNWASSAL